MRTVLNGCRDAVRRLGRLLGRVVNDSPPSAHPPGSNYIANSNGEGGRVISSGDSGAV